MTMIDGGIIHEGTGPKHYSIHYLFLSCFPNLPLESIVRWTSRKMEKIKKKCTTKVEILRFFGVPIFTTRFEFYSRSELWSRERISKYIPAPCFGDTGFSLNRFENLLRCITFSNTALIASTSQSQLDRWTLVDDFVEAFNTHRKNTFTPSDRIF